MLITIGQYFDPWEAHILRARLIAEGIPATVLGDQHITANWPISIALGGVALQVPSEFEAQAAELIAAYHSGELEKELLEDQPDVQDSCPTCQGTDLRSSVPVKQRALALLTTLWVAVPFSTAASTISCQSCGAQWRYGG
jgi:hypothetical protein